MESLPYGLTLKKNKKKKKPSDDSNKISEVNKIIINDNTLLLKLKMEKCGYFPKTNYFIDNKIDEQFPETYNFQKLFPNFTNYFKNLDYNFSHAIESKTYIDKNNNISKTLKNFILDQSDKWNSEIVRYIGYYWDLFDKKVKIHTLIFLYMVDVFINKDKLNDYDKNILYWAILFHDVGKFHEMNTIYKEDYSKNKFIDKSHPFKSAIVFIKTMINQKLIFFKDENEKNEFITFFEKCFVKTLYESFEKEPNKYSNLAYNINFNNFTDIEKFLLKLKSHKENNWFYEITILIIFHQSLPNNDPHLHGRHINEPLLDIKYIKELFDVRLLELMRIILIYDSSSHCILNSTVWEQEIDKYFDLLIKNNCDFEEYEDLSYNNIVYLAELDGDLDDIIAVEYLYNNYTLKCIVCDPKPNTKIGKMRESNLKKLGIEIYYEIPLI